MILPKAPQSASKSADPSLPKRPRSATPTCRGRKPFTKKGHEETPQNTEHQYNTTKPEPKKRRAKSRQERKGTDFDQYPKIVKTLADITSTASTASRSGISATQAMQLHTAILTNSTDTMARLFTNIPQIKQAMVRTMSLQMGSRPLSQRKKKGDNRSSLIKTTYDDLATFTWTELVEEATAKYPEWVEIMLSVMLQPEERTDPRAISRVVPKIGFMYGIMLQTRCHELSRVQRVLAMVLASHMSEKTVNYDHYSFY